MADRHRRRDGGDRGVPGVINLKFTIDTYRCICELVQSARLS